MESGRIEVDSRVDRQRLCLACVSDVESCEWRIVSLKILDSVSAACNRESSGKYLFEMKASPPRLFLTDTIGSTFFILLKHGEIT